MKTEMKTAWTFQQVFENRPKSKKLTIDFIHSTSWCAISVSAVINSTIPLMVENYTSYIKSINIMQEDFIAERV